MTRKIHLMLAATVVVLGLNSAWAADFTLEVPVEISNVPAAVTSARISCRVVRWPDPSRPGSGTPGEMSLNLGYPFPLSGGAYRGVVRVELNANPGRRPQDANGYSCSLYFDDFSGTALMAQYPPAAGTTPVINFNAAFPPAGR
jgi:hypothetical protein